MQRKPTKKTENGKSSMQNVFHDAPSNLAAPGVAVPNPNILLTKDNYHLWVKMIKLRLKSAALWHVIEGDAATEEEELLTTIALMTSIDPSIISSIHEEVPINIWKSLQERFAANTPAAIHALQRELMNCNQRSQSIIQYSSHLREIFAKFITLGKPLSSSEKATAFIHGLNPNLFQGFISRWSCESELPSFETVV